MHWHEDITHPFSGIAAKLKRAKETIGDLNARIDAFFKASKYPTMPDIHTKEFLDACAYHKALVIPKEFSVISGEVVHHLRSCLDHVAWHFTSGNYRSSHENSIAFPISKFEPRNNKDEVSNFERKIKGIEKSRVVDLIKEVQPYSRPDNPIGDLLCIVHELDRFDKHREIALIVSCGGIDVPYTLGVDLAFLINRYCQGETLSDSDFLRVKKALENDCSVSPAGSPRRF